jgi:hypothetical protein
MTREKLSTLVLATALSATFGGCTLIRETGVSQLGPDTYRVAVARTANLGGEAESQKLAMVEGQSFCSGLQQQFVLLEGRHWAEHMGGYELDFRCIATLQQQQFGSPPRLGPEAGASNRR